MKIQFRSMLFALVLPLAACGGNADTNTVSMAPQDFLPKPIVSNDAGLSETPVAIETPAVAKPASVAQPSTTDIKAKPGTADYYVELARQYISQDKRAQAVAAAKKAVKLAPTSSQAWNTMGRAELTAKNYEDAITAFTKSVELNDDNTFAWNNLGYTELLLKRYQDAADHLAEATSKKDATGYMFNNLGAALEHLDKLDDARMAYEAGGKLGSTEAAASRKRLDGVKTVVAVKIDENAGSGSTAEAPKSNVKEYSVNDGDDGDSSEPVAEQVKSQDGDAGVGSGSGSADDSSDTATH